MRLGNCRPQANLTAEHQGVLKAVVANSIWTQDRLHMAGMVESPLCQVCQQQAGLRHRPWCCPAHDSFRRQYGMPSSFW
eukprot:16437071-Heterocapsa_arctica.AAC.2